MEGTLETSGGWSFTAKTSTSYLSQGLLPPREGEVENVQQNQYAEVASLDVNDDNTCTQL